MQELTQQAQQAVQNIASKYNLSTFAVQHMLQAVVNGGGTMAQFSVPELGGSGQWMQGGMTMVGDMFNSGLQNTVSNLCAELSQLINNMQVYVVKASAVGGFSSSNWWPSELGVPNSSGAQNNVRYAYFSQSRRLAIDLSGTVTVYDTLDHQISGVSQQQGGGSSVQFSSQYGYVDVRSLPLVSGVAGVAQMPSTEQPEVDYVVEAPILEATANPIPTSSSAVSINSQEIIEAIEQIANLHAKGILSDHEFQTKKAELLKRL